MITIGMREKILAQTSKPKEQINLLYEMVFAAMEKEMRQYPIYINMPEADFQAQLSIAKCMETGRLIQAGFGGTHLEAEMMEHINKLIDRMDMMLIDQYYIRWDATMWEIIRWAKNRIFDADRYQQFDCITLGDLVEAQILSGEFDDELIVELTKKLHKVNGKR